MERCIRTLDDYVFISREQCGQAGKQIQRTIVTTVGETAENFNQDQHHSSEALSETETMHASTMNSDNHARRSNRDESPDPLIELLSSPIDSSTSVTNGGASRTTTQRITCTRKQKIKQPSTIATKEWKKLDEDLNNILETSLCGDVERKLTAMTTIIYTVSQERFEVEETSGKTQ